MELRIGQLAEETGCQVATIRYYDAQHRRRLLFVRRLRDLGFSLDEVCTLLRMIDGGAQSCAEVQALGQLHAQGLKG